MADGGIELVTKISTEVDALQAIRAVTQFCQANRENIERIDGLTRAVDDLTQAQKVLAAADTQRMLAAPVDASQRELLREYVIRSDEFDPERGAGARQYSAGGKTVTEEAGLVRLFGRSYTNSDGNEVEYVPGLIDDPQPISDAQRELQFAWSSRAFVQALQRHIKPGVAPRTPTLDRKILRIARGMGAEVARAFVDSANVGADWIPDEWMPSVETYVKHERRVAALFRELPVTRETSFLPYLSAGFIPYVHGEATGDDPAQIKLSSVGTDKRQINSKTLAIRTQIGDNAAEDALLPFMEILMQEGGFALVSAEEDAIINGDTNATHDDTALATWNPDSFYAAAPGGLSIDHRRMCLGLRAQANDRSNTTDRGTFSLTTLSADAATLVGPKMGARSEVMIPSNYVLAAKLLILDQVVTREKYGDGASIVTGEVARILGRPVVPSQFLTKDLNASGVYDGVTTTKSGLLQVQTSRYIRPVRRGVTVAFQRDETRGITNVIWKMRGLPLFCVSPSSTEKNVHFAYNMS